MWHRIKEVQNVSKYNRAKFTFSNSNICKREFEQYVEYKLYFEKSVKIIINDTSQLKQKIKILDVSSSLS